MPRIQKLRWLFTPDSSRGWEILTHYLGLVCLLTFVCLKWWNSWVPLKGPWSPDQSLNNSDTEQNEIKQAIPLPSLQTPSHPKILPFIPEQEVECNEHEDVYL